MWTLTAAGVTPSCIPKPQEGPGNVLTGTASWYGPDFHGRSTSNGEVFNMYDLTAAHKTLPFGTRVMVTNLLNGKSVQVRINDRGPFISGRIIDLSYAAARLLEMIGPGTAEVRLEVLGLDPPPASSFRYSVQVGAFMVRDNANEQARSLAMLPGLPKAVLSEYRTAEGTYYRLRIPASSQEEAQELARRLAEAGYQVIILGD